jgi:EAL domain-containing protein (putative c-di-GMP-specific phosphodiesterase class I)
MKKGIFCSMEALIRLHESDGTLISPGEFIPIAEQAGMIVPITWFVIEQSCAAMASNPELRYISVSVNVPMSQLVDTDFLDHLNSITDKYGIEHNRICLEFTERVMLDDFARVKARMDAVSACGYRFFLDDFGTGFSNFNCLLQLPFCDVKLDKSLTDTVTSNSSEGNVVLMLTELFHKMNLKVIAEGVETEEQSRILSEYGIDRIQGYYYSAPMSLDRVLNFYREHPITEKVL